MCGEGKRDYPAPISYQSPWHKEYKYLEDHFARINTALVRGTPEVKIAVVYPIDTYKMLYASMAETKNEREEIENNYKETTEWLLSAGYDFDFLSESLLPDLAECGSYPLKVGKMEYTTVVVSDCMTLRPHTIRVLEKFRSLGGNLIIMGRAPEFSDAVASVAAKNLAAASLKIPHSKEKFLEALKEEPIADIRYASGGKCESLITTARLDGKYKWIFFAHKKKPDTLHLSNPEKLKIRVKGGYRVTLFDTLSGEILPIEYENLGEFTDIYATLFDLDTLLLRLESERGESSYKKEPDSLTCAPLNFDFKGEYKLHEPNVFLLDTARFSIDGGELSEREEIMRIDGKVRESLGLPLRKFKVIQPWAAPKTENTHTVKLVYDFKSECEIRGASLATEHPETLKISFNGDTVSNAACGYYVDRGIKTLPLPVIRKGENRLELEMPFGERVDLEASYIVGDFGTYIKGDTAFITKRPEALAFGDAGTQGFAFYGGNIDYTGDVFLQKDGELIISANHFRGALIGVKIDGEELGKIICQPYSLSKKLKAGKHSITLTLFGTRYNTFSALHNLNADKKRVYIGPDFWRSEGEAFSYEYHTRKLGILAKPQISLKS